MMVLTPPRKWWLLTRDATRLAWFRSIVSVALVVHFATKALEVAPHLGVDPRAAPAGSDTAARGFDASPLVLAAALGVGMILAVATALGMQPRRCSAGIFAISVLSFHAAGPNVGLADRTAILFSLFMVLLPSCERTALRAAGQERLRVPGVSATAFLIYVCFVYIQSARHLENTYLSIALQSVPVLYLLPGSAFQLLAVVVQVVTHASLVLSGGSLLSNGCLCATGILFWGELDEQRGEWVLDAGGVAAIAFVAVSAAAFVSEQTKQDSQPARLVARLGVVPSAWQLGPVKVRSAALDRTRR